MTEEPEEGPGAADVEADPPGDTLPLAAAPRRPAADGESAGRRPAPNAETDAADPVKRVLTIHRATWELELLISGAVVFSLFQLPSLLTNWYLAVDLHLARDEFFLPFFSYYGAMLIVIALILGFSLHFLARGFWVALCGLNEVFPEGVDWDEVEMGPLSREYAETKMLGPKALEKSVDRFASTVFSVLFYVICAMVGVTVLVLIAGLVLGSLVRWAFPDLHPLAVFYICLVVAMLPLFFVLFVDNWFKKDPSRIESHPRLASICRWVVAYTNVIVGQRFYGAIPMTFATRFSSRAASLAFGTATLLLAVIFIGGFLLRSGLVGWDSYVYLPVGQHEKVVSSDHYEDRRDPESRARVPTLDSEVVDGPYLRLYIPYRPTNDGELLAYACPDIPEVHASGFYFTPRAADRSREQDFESTLTCLERVWTVAIDGQRRNVDFLFSRHPERKTEGVVARIPMSQLAPGLHELEVRRGVPEVEGQEPQGGAPSALIHKIPFWR